MTPKLAALLFYSHDLKKMHVTTHSIQFECHNQISYPAKKLKKFCQYEKSLLKQQKSFVDLVEYVYILVNLVFGSK